MIREIVVNEHLDATCATFCDGNRICGDVASWKITVTTGYKVYSVYVCNDHKEQEIRWYK